jgi:hypothetical protein
MTRQRRATLIAIFGGGFTAGLLDILDPIVTWGIEGVSPVRILQSVASGLLGPAAFTGGWRTALLGVAAHFTISIAVAAVFWWTSRRVPLLVQRPIVGGLLCGAGMWLFMKYLVVPLSAANIGGEPSWPALINQWFAHLVLFGQPIAWISRYATRINDGEASVMPRIAMKLAGPSR